MTKILDAIHQLNILNESASKEVKITKQVKAKLKNLIDKIVVKGKVNEPASDTIVCYAGALINMMHKNDVLKDDVDFILGANGKPGDDPTLINHAWIKHKGQIIQTNEDIKSELFPLVTIHIKKSFTPEMIKNIINDEIDKLTEF